MKTSAIAIILAGVFTAGAAAADDRSACTNVPQAHSHVTTRAHAHCGTPVRKQPIRINCYRGPWRETIWDHPQGSFVDDLVTFGYDYANAEAIATRICKDENLVGDAEAQKTALLRAIAQTPPGH